MPCAPNGAPDARRDEGRQGRWGVSRALPTNASVGRSVLEGAARCLYPMQGMTAQYGCQPFSPARARASRRKVARDARCGLSHMLVCDVADCDAWRATFLPGESISSLRRSLLRRVNLLLGMVAFPLSPACLGIFRARGANASHERKFTGSTGSGVWKRSLRCLIASLLQARKSYSRSATRSSVSKSK